MTRGISASLHILVQATMRCRQLLIRLSSRCCPATGSTHQMKSKLRSLISDEKRSARPPASTSSDFRMRDASALTTVLLQKTSDTVHSLDDESSWSVWCWYLTWKLLLYLARPARSGQALPPSKAGGRAGTIVEDEGARSIMGMRASRSWHSCRWHLHLGVQDNTSGRQTSLRLLNLSEEVARQDEMARWSHSQRQPSRSWRPCNRVATGARKSETLLPRRHFQNRVLGLH